MVEAGGYKPDIARLKKGESSKEDCETGEPLSEPFKILGLVW